MPLSSLASVFIGNRPPKRLAPILVLIAGIAAAIEVSRTQDLATAFSTPVYWLALACVAPGVLWLFLQRGEYVLEIESAGGKTRAIQTRDRGFIKAVAQALDQAVIERLP
ncbi:DUF6232 family protein [Paraburkholderia sp. MPAMCS5]|uniref:DUF6232 family protein n=1 Tax=Paraburkholderia sp. MPAMCS5 TaxID=3112563 RepID=UPI003FA7E01F